MSHWGRPRCLVGNRTSKFDDDRRSDCHAKEFDRLSTKRHLEGAQDSCHGDMDEKKRVLILVDERRIARNNVRKDRVPVTTPHRSDDYRELPQRPSFKPIVPKQQDVLLSSKREVRRSREHVIPWNPTDLEARIQLLQKEIDDETKTMAERLTGMKPSESSRYFRRGSEYLCMLCRKSSKKYDSAKHHFIRKHRQDILKALERSQ